MDIPWNAVIVAASTLSGIALGNRLRIGGEHRTEINRGRLETYSRCIGNFSLGPIIGSLIQMEDKDTLGTTVELLSQHYRALGEAEIYADEPVREALRETQHAMVHFHTRLDTLISSGTPPEKGLNDAWDELMQDPVDELIRRMRGQLRIK